MNAVSTLPAGPRVPSFQEWFGFIKDTVKGFSKRVSSLLDGVFRPYEHDGMKKNDSKPTSFKPLFESSVQPRAFEAIVPKMVPQNAVEKPISWAKETTIFVKTEKILPTIGKAKFYTLEWIYADTFPAGTKVQVDPSKPVLVKGDKTFVSIVWHNSAPYSKKTSQKEHVFEPGLIETPWIKADKVEHKKTKPTTFSPGKNLFGGYIWPNGKEIPAYIMEAVTINYFGKVIAPKLLSSIAQVEAEISENRELIKTEFLQKKVPLHKTSRYNKQKSALAKKWSLNQVYGAIQSFTLNGTNVLSPDVTTVLKSIAKTPEWQKIICQASSVQRQKTLKKARR